MIKQEWMETATNAATEVYSRFLNDVVVENVVKDREKKSVGEKTRKKIQAGTFADPRVLRLMSFSGKGGYSADPEKQKIYARFYNVTLLDHLLSVTRGALTLAALDWMNQNPDMDTLLLKQRLSVIAAIAFMHDADKDLQLPRNASLEIEAVEERISLYGIRKFLDNVEVSLSGSQFRYLIEKVEATQSHRHAPDTPPPRDFEPLPRYVRLADQLDSAWLSSDLEKGRLRGVMKCIKDDKGCLRTDILKHWKSICLFDPHHPFLMDELQRRLSLTSLHLTGILPLIEIHQDGHLFMLLPEDQFDEITGKALNGLCKSLPFNLYLDVSNRGIPSLYNGQPDHEELEEFIAKELDSRKLGDLFKIKRDLMEQMKEPLDELLADIGLQPRWQEKGSTQLISLYTSFNDIEDADKEWLYRAAHLSLLLNMKVDAKPKHGIPDYKERETMLLDAVSQERPEWIQEAEDDASRRILTALWSVAMAEQDEDILEKIWGNSGLLKKWTEGDEENPGFNRFITGEGSEILESVRQRFASMLNRQRVITENEKAEARCVFTDEPVDFGKPISKALGLYGVKVSAFSGRDGRPELITSEKAHTNVGPSSVAEHKTRMKVYESQGGKENGVPALISSPTTTGLFGGLGMTTDKAMGVMSLYDLNRLEIKKGNVLKNVEMYQSRFRMARLERIPESLKDQVNILRMMLTATRRTGRPLHVFRGLPTLQKAYFYYDAMPRALANLLEGNALYLEQIPEAIKRLELAGEILDTPGLGHDIFKLYAMPATRFGAVCLAYCHLKDRDEKSTDSMRDLYEEYLKYKEGKVIMNEQDGALVKLGKAGACIQQSPRSTAGNNEELLVFKTCLDTANAARREKLDDITSLVYGIAGELEISLVRKQKASAKERREGKSLRDGCTDVAEIFVNDIWFGILKGRSPSQRTRRVLSSIYRMAFLKSHEEYFQKKKSSDK